jgi:hypothetical protein
MTAWAYIIAEKMGFDRLEALSLGRLPPFLPSHPLMALLTALPFRLDMW